ncbi:MAG: MBL fold metallo-hydrolase [Eubacterium sp.]|nr:MBL fold metallo-hydrolase [Eubacterium sp.]
MKIINLVEDTKGGDCLNEHGLSFYIETKKHKLLVDSGATDMFLHNADVLGVDLTQVDTFILSHGHYDHAGGLTAFAKINSNAKIYLKDSVGGDYYHLSSEREIYIGIDKKILELPQIIKVQENMQIDDELFLFSDFKGKRYPAWSNQELKQKVGNVYIQDDFAHEQCLVISQGEQHILMSGCAHNGILSILDSYLELFGAYPDTVISGFHMMKKSDYTEVEEDYIRQTACELMKTKAMFYTGHCTGQKAFVIMKEMMGEQLQGFHSGSELEMI